MRNKLAQHSVTTASKWAENYRMLGGGSFPGPWRFEHHPWLRDMHDSRAPKNIGQKSAQMGYTETLLNIVFFNIDVRKWDCLYLLPAQKPDATDFTGSRFNPALEASEHLSNMFSDVKNLGHKRSGACNLYIRGSRSKSQLKSIPVNFIAFDEVDEMEQDNIPLAMERTSGQTEKQIWMISTPTIDNYGINKYYRMTTQEHFFFPCPCCGKQIELTFPDSLVVTGEHLLDPNLKNSYYRCTECKGTIHHEDKKNFLQKGKWIATQKTDDRGFHINQLYSPAMAGKPAEIAEAYLRSQRDPAEEQEFFNSKLGMTHVVDGARIDEGMLLACINEGHKRLPGFDGKKLVTMGVDQGKFLHVEICAWDVFNQHPGVDVNMFSRPRVIWYGKLTEFEELDRFMQKYRVNFCVMDAQPERRKAYEFAMRHYGRVKLCFYSNGMRGKHIIESKEVQNAINVDRTTWLDLSLGRFKKGKEKEGILLPLDLDHEYREQIQALVRIYEKDKEGNPIGRYVNGSVADHYAHARNYAEIALPLALGMGTAQSMSGVL